MSRLQTKREGPEGPEARAWHTEARGLSTVTWGGPAETAEWSWGARTCGASHIPEELCRLLGSRWEGSQWKVLSRGTDVTCVPTGCWVEHRLKAARSRGPVTTRIQVRKDGGSGEVRGTLTTDTYRIGWAAPPHLCLQNSSSPVPDTPEALCGGCGVDTGLRGPRKLCGPETRLSAPGLAADERSMTGAQGCQCGFS